MDKKIYVQLLNEGTKVYRPIQAFEIETNVYKIVDNQIYDSDDEHWEFTQVLLLLSKSKILKEKMF